MLPFSCSCLFHYIKTSKRVSMMESCAVYCSNCVTSQHTNIMKVHIQTTNDPTNDNLQSASAVSHANNRFEDSPHNSFSSIEDGATLIIINSRLTIALIVAMQKCPPNDSLLSHRNKSTRSWVLSVPVQSTLPTAECKFCLSAVHRRKLAYAKHNTL